MTGWRRTAVWTVAAIAGLVLAAALTTAASTLSNQRVGLSSEPLSAGSSLAPTETATPRPSASPRPTRTATPRPTRTATPRPTRTATPRPTSVPTAVPTAAPTDDHGGSSGRGRGRGRGSDD
jgi:hypothetical protein